MHCFPSLFYLQLFLKKLAFKKAEWKKRGRSVVKLGEPPWDFGYDSLITDQ